MSELGMEKVAQFSDDYIRIAFQFWYSNGCLSPKDVLKLDGFPTDELGRKPSDQTIRKWRDERDWKIRADELNAKAHLLADNDLVSAKARMLKKQADNAVKIQEKALDAMLTDGFDSSAAAVNAYFRATEEQRKAQGIGDLIERLSEMSDEKLQEKILQLSSRASGGDGVIDVAPVDTESGKDEKDA